MNPAEGANTSARLAWTGAVTVFQFSPAPARTWRVPAALGVFSGDPPHDVAGRLVLLEKTGQHAHRRGRVIEEEVETLAEVVVIRFAVKRLREAVFGTTAIAERTHRTFLALTGQAIAFVHPKVDAAAAMPLTQACASRECSPAGTGARQSGRTNRDRRCVRGLDRTHKWVRGCTGCAARNRHSALRRRAEQTSCRHRAVPNLQTRRSRTVRTCTEPTVRSVTEEPSCVYRSRFSPGRSRQPRFASGSRSGVDRSTIGMN